MSVVTSDTGLEPGLSLDEIESRLVASARRHHVEERNMAYWLYEVERRSLHRERGFSSLGDYARELIDVSPRKAQYLVFIASRLEKLPRICQAFDFGEIPWTKAREIVRVATPETEEEWLEKANALSSRDLERAVRASEGMGSGEWATLTISLPVELMRQWNECYELSERLCASDLEKWQVLEPMMAEYLATYVPAEHEDGPSPRETDDEKAVPSEVRLAVLERAGYRCEFPGCSMRKMLDVHHLEFRSHGGGHEPSNLICFCRVHHGLAHRGVCKIRREASGSLVFERPQLFTEKKSVETPPFASTEEPTEESEAPPVVPAESNDWREEVVAAVFDGASSPERPPRHMDFADFLSDWVQGKAARERDARAVARRRGLERRIHSRGGSCEHVFADDEHVFAETTDPHPRRVGPDASDSP